MISKYERQKYAKAMRRMDFGIWGYSKGLFHTLNLTSKQGDDMSTKRFGKDLKLLIRDIRVKGYKVEYCGCYEISPLNGLLHWHGLLRVKNGFIKLYEGETKSNKLWVDWNGKCRSEHIDANQKVISDLWKKYHNAPEIDYGIVPHMFDLQKYITKHIVKDYLKNDSGIRNVFLVSRGWKRAGIDDIALEFKNWWVNGYENSSWMGRRGYEVMNKLLKNWSEKGYVLINSNFGYFQVQGINIINEIYGEENNAEKIHDYSGFNEGSDREYWNG